MGRGQTLAKIYNIHVRGRVAVINFHSSKRYQAMSIAPANHKTDSPIILDDMKADIDHIDEGGRDVRQRKSNFDKLSITASLKTFKRAVLICTLIGFTAACDGECYFSLLFSLFRIKLIARISIQTFGQHYRQSRFHSAIC
jgi:hypothetical protein